MYRRMLVPKWMNIAVMGAESAKAEEQRKLLDMAERIEKVNEETIHLNTAKQNANPAQTRLDDAYKARRQHYEKNPFKVKYNQSAPEEKDVSEAMSDLDTVNKNVEQYTKSLDHASAELEKVTRGVAPDYKTKATEYYNERKAPYDNASKKAGRVKTRVENLERKRKKLTKAEAEKQPNAEDLKKQVNQVNISEKAVANALEESRIADEKDRYRNAAVRDREQQKAYAQANEEAKKAFNSAETAYNEASKPTNGSASNQPNGSAPAQNKSESDDASARNLTTLNTAMDEAQTAADEAKAKTEPSFMRKTLTGLAGRWTGNSGKSSEKADSGTKMGMAHFV
jgi:hypothetical protein